MQIFELAKKIVAAGPPVETATKATQFPEQSRPILPTPTESIPKTKLCDEDEALIAELDEYLGKSDQ